MQSARLSYRHRRTLLDLLPVILLAALSQVEVWTTSLRVHPRAVVAGVLLAMIAPLAWRRRVPLASTIALLAGVVALSEGWHLLDNFISPLGALMLAVYSAAATCALDRAAGVGGLVGGLVVVGGIVDHNAVGDVVFVLVILGAVWVAGRAVRSRQQRAGALAERATLLEHERDAKARAAVAEERVRIARELHDVVAHGISVIVLQARGGRKVLPAAEREARQAFEEIESTAQQALTEMRRLLGMLRRHDEELALGPQPSLVHLDALASQIREAGLPVDVVVDGDLRGLPPGVDLSAYRIVQEGLTNALKHAGPAHARVFVSRAQDELELEIIDDGRGTNGAGQSTGGHGLTGMRERVAMLGGRIDAGARDDGGFALRARLPLDGAPR